MSSPVVFWSTEAVGMVDWSSILALQSASPVSIVVGDSEGTVNGQLGVVDAETVAMGVSIVEQTPLEHSVRRRLDS